ncbi:MAG: sulfatase [Capnocytophaga sp.]|nr:sulfatase [Capnocytophaga sp.]
MKNILILLIISFSFLTTKAQNLNQKPNIIIFLVDDMGWQDTSLPFWDKRTPNNSIYRTPNMERLAAGGIKFTQGYAAAICSPSRISLITGTNAARHRVTNWTLHRNTPTDVKDSILLPPQWNVNGVSPISDVPRTYYATPLPQILKDSGYYTICIGKAHFGATNTIAENPLRLGFQVNVAGHAGGGLASYTGLTNFGNREDGRPQSPFAIPNLEKYWGKDISVTQALTQEALNALQHRPKDKPFFLYLSHYAVHTPIEEDKRFIDNYKDKPIDSIEKRYASMIEAMDKSLGDVLDYLKENALEESTFILFLSDNGGLSAVARGGVRDTHNYPLQSGKGSAYEGGIRVPVIASWKGHIPSNEQSSQPIIIEDIFPTILDIANVQPTHLPQKIDGQSFFSALKGERKNKKRSLFWHLPNNWYNVEGNGYGASTTIREGDWKLIYFHKTGEKQLFNIRKDISETRNLAKDYPRKVKRLSKKMNTYLKETKAQLPIRKDTQKEIPYP